jgi:ribosomal protein S18 acetylase RimI-like enzyme
MIELIPVTEKEYSIVSKLAYDIWPFAFKDILAPEQINYMLEWMYSISSIKDQVEKKGHHYILAKEGSCYVGYASYEINCKTPGKTKLHKIYILPELHGKGVGKILVNYVSGKAIENKNKFLFLNVNRFNNAVKFYEAMGFKVIAEEDIDIGNGYFMNDFVMEKELAYPVNM